jgi:hypothetical protein
MLSKLSPLRHQALRLRTLSHTLPSLPSVTSGPSRSYNFASSEYISCFQKTSTIDVTSLRTDTLAYLSSFDAQSWHTDPVTSVLNGVPHSGASNDTVDAFGTVNGKILHASDATLDSIIEHVNNYKPVSPSVMDYRKAVRAVEQKLLTDHAGLLIGNQAKDFLKQDGVTEIEESIQANLVERNMNDILLEDEMKGKIVVDRSPVFVGCVSNFSNFLDLFRKTIRNLELGIPCVVLSRTNTTQHMYRWFVLLQRLCKEQGIDDGMLTYISSDLDGIKRVFRETPDTCPMLITCSRDLAKAVKSDHSNTMASTGGPNTLVAAGPGVLSKQIKEAIRFSSMIENSGQCTALRHAVVANADKQTSDIENIWADAPVVNTPAESLEAGEFAGVFAHSPEEATTPTGYTKINGLNAHYKISNNLPEDGVEEYWRKVFVDVTSTDEVMKAGSKDADDLSNWLVRNQPITLAVNDDYELGKYLFERTGQVVYTVGENDTPALSCQARPQEGEIFGEFPVRKELREYTKFPVVVPTPMGAYNSQFSVEYLKEVAASNSKGAATDTSGGAAVQKLLELVKDDTKRGYAIAILDYLRDSVGPKTGYGARTVLWGLQTPPQDGKVTVLRIEEGETVDDVAAKVVCFLSTNARSMLEVSCADEATSDLFKSLGVTATVVETAADFAARETGPAGDNFYNVIGKDSYGVSEFPLPGQFCSLFLGVGHVKSTQTNDQKFVDTFKDSKKWLKMAE